MATCAGCNKSHTEFPCYDDDMNPVTSDGSYANGKFVCDDCYIGLIRQRLDVGTPHQLQERASLLFSKK